MPRREVSWMGKVAVALVVAFEEEMEGKRARKGIERNGKKTALSFEKPL